MATGPQLWTVSALAVEFQKKPTTISKRLEGVEPDAVRGRSKLYLMRNAAPAILGVVALDPTQQRAALENARTRKLELEIAELEGELLDGAIVQRAVEDMIGRCRAKLLVIPGAQAGRANPEDPKRAEAAIRDGIHDALSELASGSALGGLPEMAASTKANGNGVGGHLPAVEPGVELGAWEVED